MTINTLLKNRLFLTFLLLGMLEPRCIGELAQYRGGIWATLHNCNSLLIYLELLAVILIILMTVRKISIFSITVIIFQGYGILADINNGLPYQGDMLRAMQAIGLILLLEVCCRKRIQKNFMEVLSFWLGLYILINFITILIYPDGMYIDNRGWSQNYFFGYKNSHIYIYLPYLACSALRDILKFGTLKRRYYIFTVVITIASFLADSSTSGIVSLLVAILIIFAHNLDLPKWFNSATAMTCSVILSIAMIGFGFQERFAGIIQLLFNKDATFTNRTAIWAASLVDIMRQPIWGNGNGNVDIVLYWDVTQCHNKFLDVLFVGGIIMAAIFIFLMYLSCSRLIKDRGKIGTNIMTFVMTGYAILFLMESRRPDVLIFIVFAMAFHIRLFDTESVLNRGKQHLATRIKIKIF